MAQSNKTEQAPDTSYCYEAATTARRAHFTAPLPRDLNTQIWFEMTPNLAVDILLCTCFIDQFIRGIFSAQQKDVPRYTQPVATLSEKLTRTDSSTTGNSKTDSTTSTQRTTKNDKHVPVPVMLQIALKSFTQQPL